MIFASCVLSGERPAAFAAEASTLLTASGHWQASVEPPAGPGMSTLRRLAQNLGLAYRDDGTWRPAGPQNRKATKEESGNS